MSKIDEQRGKYERFIRTILYISKSDRIFDNSDRKRQRKQSTSGAEKRRDKCQSEDLTLTAFGSFV